MEPHRPRTQQSDAAERPKRGRRRDTLPLDAQWLEQEAIRYVAQWETTASGLAETLERRLHSRCQRTGEDAATILSSIPLVVGQLVERGYVDDRRFAEQQITRGRRQGRSGAQIRARLQAKGVEPETIEEVEQKLRSEQSADPHSPPTPIDEDLLAAWRTARKRRLGPYCADPAERSARRQRHLGVLARQGFSRDIAHQVVDATSPPESDRLEDGR